MGGGGFGAAPKPAAKKAKKPAPLQEEEVNPGAVAGTALRILEYPHPLLRADNADVVDFDYKLKKLTKDLQPRLKSTGQLRQKLRRFHLWWLITKSTGDSSTAKMSGPAIVVRRRRGSFSSCPRFVYRLSL